MGATVALTGATGFIGGHVAEALVACGHRVRALARRDDPALRARGIELVLGGLDSVRVQALTSDGPGRLSDVYTDSDAAAADRRLLREYADRGLVLRGAALQRLRCEVAHRGDDRIVLDVVDRLGRTWIVDSDGRERELPRAAAVQRSVTVVHTVDGWRIAAVS